MISIPCTTPQTTWVGIDIAKKYNDVMVDRPGRRRRRFRVANQLEDYHRFGCRLGTLSPSWRQMRWTRFAFTRQPSNRSNAVIRR